ncbi:TonB-dependent receptor [Methylosinus sp. H3A]|uniref:TonB-dependent receptor n=1 Tax=Methylosinus sp. H3A TaxID=2785786 RepID=UPI0018C1E370|nr:TonB-dependent receptor [Methylosinus sp. H3A]MBG0809076.1 TonB-dependent receptor [Methylosinus sp. H3A]
MKFRRWLFSCASLAPYSLLGGALLVGPFPNAPAFAQDAQIEDVIVRGDEAGARREAQAQKAPRAIKVITSDTIEEQQLQTLDDFALKISNYRPNTSTAQWSFASIRGVGAGSNTGVGAHSATGFVLDNVFWQAPGFQWMNFTGISSFEVAYGPQGTAGGKNTTMGSVVVHSQVPSFARKATLETSYGSYGRTTEKVNVTGPIIEDALAYRVTAYFDRDNGFIHDQITGAGYGNFDRWGVRGQLLFVGDEISDRLIFSYASSNEYRNYFRSAIPIGNSSLIYANGTVPATSYAQNFASRLGRPVLTFDPYKPYMAREGTDPQRNYTVSNELNVGIGDYLLTSISAYGFERGLERGFSDGNQLAAIRSGSMDTYAGQGSQELRFSSPKGQPFEWQVGLYGFAEDVLSQMHHVQFGADATKWYSLPAALPGVTDWWHVKATSHQAAGYANATYHIDEQAAITFGIRDSWERRGGSASHRPSLYYGAQYSAFQQEQAIIASGGWGWSDTGHQAKYRNMLTALVNPEYKYNDNITLFGLVGRGEKASAVNITGTGPIYVKRDGVYYLVDHAPLLGNKPEVSWDYELGVKTNWLDERLFLNLTAYWTDLYNFQVVQSKTSYDTNGAPISVSNVGNAEQARMRGVEFDGRWSPIEKLWITFSGSLSDARWVKYTQAPAPSDWAWSTPANAPAGFVKAPQYMSLSNTRWTNLPRWAFRAGANYEQPLGAVFSGSGLGPWAEQPISAFGYFNVAYTDKVQLTNPWSVVQYWNRPYVDLSVGAGLKTSDNRYRLTFWGKNLFNVVPFMSWSPGSGSTPTSVTLGMPPVTYGGTLSVVLD